MMRSTWMLALLATVLGVAVSAGTLYYRGSQLIEAHFSKRQVPFGSGLPRARDWDFWTAEMATLAQNLKQEKEELAERRSDLDALAKRLEAEKQELLRVRSEVVAIRQEIDERVTTMLAAEKPNIKALSRTYASMKPEQAVTILANMDDTNIVKLLSVMRPEVTANILSEMALAGEKIGSGEDEGSVRAARLSDQLRLLRQEKEKQADSGGIQ